MTDYTGSNLIFTLKKCKTVNYFYFVNLDSVYKMNRVFVWFELKKCIVLKLNHFEQSSNTFTCQDIVYENIERSNVNKTKRIYDLRRITSFQITTFIKSGLKYSNN